MVQSGGDEADWGLRDALGQRKTTTMQRRNLLIGMGSLAAGGAATIGTGAFTSVTANRSIEVDTADDSDAFLGIEADDTSNADEYVDASGGTVSLDFTNTNNSGYQGGGSGINANGTTVFDDLLNVTNQGTQTVIVGHRQSFQPQKGALYHEDYEDEPITRVGDAVEEFDTIAPDAISEPDNNITNLDTAKLRNLPVLEPGDTLEDIGFFVTPGTNPADDFIDGTITFLAGAEPTDLGTIGYKDDGSLEIE